MKGKIKKLVALALATIMVLAMGINVSAQEIDAEKDGKATITITNPKKGVEYKVYKVFDATTTATSDTEEADVEIAYKLRAGKSAPDRNATGFATDVNGFVTAVDENQKVLTTDQAAALKKYAVEGGNGELVASGSIEDAGELKFTNLEYGYYLVVSGNNAAVSINSTTPDMEIIDKNPSGPTPTDPDKGPKTADNGLVEIGGRASYTVEFNTTNYETVVDETTNEVKSIKIATYEIKDTTKGNFLDDVTVDSVTIYQDGKDATTGIVKLSPVPQFNDENVLKINWTNDGTTDGKHLYKDGSILEIKYHGTVNANVKAGEANTNNVEIGWNGSTTKIPGEDDVYTASITIDKVNGAAEDKTAASAKLVGAKFVILDTAVGTDDVIPDEAKCYTVAEDGKIGTVKVNTLKNADGTYQWPEAAVVTTDTNGAAEFVGLMPDKSYYLFEVEAPRGFNRFTGTKEIKIGAANDATEIAALKNKTQVENNAGAVLPSTGGIGTTIFYVVGGILVVGAGILLITKKRMSKSN